MRPQRTAVAACSMAKGSQRRTRPAKKSGTQSRFWRPVKVSQSFFSVSGGLCNKAQILKTTEVDTSGGIKHLVRVTKGERWLHTCAAGVNAGKGALKRSKVLSRLNVALAEAVAAQDAGEAATAVGDAVDGEDPMNALDEDPMNALDAVEATDSPTPKKKKVYQKTRVENHIFSVDMPILPEEAGAEAEAAGTRRVDVMARGAKTILIGVTDVDWLITYVAKELELGNVALVPPSAASASAVAGGGDAAVAGGRQDFRLRWDFAAVGDPGWTADILKGALAGKTFTCKLANLDVDKWARVAAAVSGAGAVAVPLEEATFQQRKDGAMLYTEAYCKRVMQEAAVAASTAK